MEAIEIESDLRRVETRRPFCPETSGPALHLLYTPALNTHFWTPCQRLGSGSESKRQEERQQDIAGRERKVVQCGQMRWTDITHRIRCALRSPSQSHATPHTQPRGTVPASVERRVERVKDGAGAGLSLTVSPGSCCAYAGGIPANTKTRWPQPLSARTTDVASTPLPLKVPICVAHPSHHPQHPSSRASVSQTTARNRASVGVWIESPILASVEHRLPDCVRKPHRGSSIHLHPVEDGMYSGRVGSFVTHLMLQRDEQDPHDDGHALVRGGERAEGREQRQARTQPHHTQPHPRNAPVVGAGSTARHMRGLSKASASWSGSSRQNLANTSRSRHTEATAEHTHAKEATHELAVERGRVRTGRLGASG